MDGKSSYPAAFVAGGPTRVFEFQRQKKSKRDAKDRKGKGKKAP